MDEDAIRDATGNVLEEGLKVRVLSLPPGLTNNLPPEDVEFLDRAVGMIGEVDEISAGFVCVLLMNGHDNWHFVYFRGPELEIVP